MSSYAELIRRRREANALYLKLRSLGLHAYTEPDAGRPAGYRVVVEGLKSLNPDHAARLMRMVRANEPALAEVLPKRRPRLRIVGQEGPTP